MKTYKITIEWTDAIKAENEQEAWDKLCWDILPEITDLSDYIEIEECNKQTYKEYTRHE